MVLFLDTETCSLCQFAGINQRGEPQCLNCPIVETQGKTCDEEFREACRGDYMPMIDLLTETVKALELIP